MKKITLLTILCFCYGAFAYEFKCDFEVYGSTEVEKITLLSEKENIQTNFNGHDISIQFAHRQEVPSVQDYYNFSVSGPDTSPYIFNGYIIQDCGFGTRSIQIMCTPIK